MKIDPEAVLNRIRSYHNVKPPQLRIETEDALPVPSKTNGTSTAPDNDKSDDPVTSQDITDLLRQYAEQCFVITEMIKDIESSKSGDNPDNMKMALANIKGGIEDFQAMQQDLTDMMLDYLTPFAPS
jgi:hypothetical protein